MKIKLLALFIGFALTIPANGVQAQKGHGEKAGTPAVEVGNQICPVSGEKIGSMGEPVKYTYKGKVYNLCCPMCIKDFKNNPEKYSKIAEDEVKRRMGQTEGNQLKNHPIAPAKDNEIAISYYTCGMHPSVRVSVENYKNGDTKCPICFMPLTPVRKSMEMASSLGENVISKVAIQARELKLAGVKTEPAVKRELFKEIRAVGKVAYDPQLAVAQDELVSAVNSYEKAKQGGIKEIANRAQALVNSSKRKLQLLGLSKEQISELEKSKTVQENLILPEDKMWIYGDVYEYEMPWVKEGAFVKITSIGLPGKEYYGKIVSINPVVDPQTRSVRFRALIDNPGQELKPEMYVDCEIMSQYTDPNGNTEVLSIPKSALLDTGRREIVWVAKSNGDFEGRKVELGPEAIDHSDNPRHYYPVLKGIMEGERVVTEGNFLIDSQSQITGVASSAYGGAVGKETTAKTMDASMPHMH